MSEKSGTTSAVLDQSIVVLAESVAVCFGLQAEPIAIASAWAVTGQDNSFAEVTASRIFEISIRTSVARRLRVQRTRCRGSFVGASDGAARPGAILWAAGFGKNLVVCGRGPMLPKRAGSAFDAPIPGLRGRKVVHVYWTTVHTGIRTKVIVPVPSPSFARPAVQRVSACE